MYAVSQTTLDLKKQNPVKRARRLKKNGLQRVFRFLAAVVQTLQAWFLRLRSATAVGAAKLAERLTVSEGEGPMNGRDKSNQAPGSGTGLRVIKSAPAMRVIFFYPGEEGTYIDNVHVTLYENGIVHIRSNHEETTTHLQNCEVLWRYQLEADDRPANKIRLLKPKGEHRSNAESFDSQGPQLAGGGKSTGQDEPSEEPAQGYDEDPAFDPNDEPRL